MLDIMRLLCYYKGATVRLAVFLLHKLHTHGIINNWPRLNQTASTVASTRNKVDRGQAILNTCLNEKSRRFWRPTSRRLFAKGLSTMRAVTRDSITYCLKVCQHNIPKLSQLNPSEFLGGSWLWRLFAAGGSAGAKRGSEVDLSAKPSILLSYPRVFLSQSPVSMPAPGGSLPGAGGLSGGAA